MGHAIEVSDLFFAYQDTLVLEEINFKVETGQFIAIIGPNGGGKTTLLNLLMGFLKPNSGKVKILGSTPKLVSKKIGWVPQHFHYDRSFPISVLEVVLTGLLAKSSFWGGYGKKCSQMALEALEKVGLKQFAKTSFSELSGGQAQRVLLARAIASEPSILFLDEPTANVDANAQKEIYKILSGLKGKITILMVTHDLRAASQHVDQVLCVEKQLSLMSPKEVCEHFALGLYHPPLKASS